MPHDGIAFKHREFAAGFFKWEVVEIGDEMGQGRRCQVGIGISGCRVKLNAIAGGNQYRLLVGANHAPRGQGIGRLFWRKRQPFPNRQVGTLVAASDHRDANGGVHNDQDRRLSRNLNFERSNPLLSDVR